MIDNNENKSEYTKGLFGETNRANGEYRFKSGDVERIYTDAHFIPYGEDATPTRYYQPERKSQKKRKKRIGFFSVALLCIACALLGGILGAGLMTAYFDSRVNEVENSVKNIADATFIGQNTVVSDTILASETSKTSEILSSEQIYSLASEQVVNISTEYVNTNNIPGVITGSGVVISADGLILTNFHVIEKAFYGDYNVTVTFPDGRMFEGVIISYDIPTDLAAVKIEASNLNFAVFDTESAINGGTEVVVAGNPYNMFTVSSGKISNPSVNVDPDDNGNIINMFQLDVSVYEGNSGGPVYNMQGKVIGIVTAKVSVGSSDGIGFAIPSLTARSLYSQMVSEGYITPASLGVEFFADYDQMFQAFYSYPEGAFIDQINTDSCAESAGLKVGDVIVEIDGKAILDYNDADRIIRQYAPGDEIEMVVFRETQLIDMLVVLD